MRSSASVLPGDFQRVAVVDRTVPDAVEAPVRRLVAEVPLRAVVLDIGCGTGEVARNLARSRGAKVTAIDVAPRMIDVARVRTSASFGVDYRVADIMQLSPRGFDVAIAVDVLQYMPLAEIADRMANAVVAGGRVLISDRFSARGLLNVPYNAVSHVATRGTDDGGHASLRSIRATLREVLPGVVVRRHLGWRYTAMWTKP